VPLTVTPRTVRLSQIPLGGAWTGSGDNRPRAFAMGSAEDVTVREYRRGDDLRQCTRRRSSPRRYSRTVTSSALPIAKARGRLSPEPVQAPPNGIWESRTVRGVTVSGTV